jgi:hypothetical protein
MVKSHKQLDKALHQQPSEITPEGERTRYSRLSWHSVRKDQQESRPWRCRKIDQIKQRDKPVVHGLLGWK